MKIKRVAAGQLVAPPLAQLRLERAEALVIGDRLRHVIAAIAGHPAAEPQVEVFDPSREVDRVVAAEREELAAIDGQHRPGRGRQVPLVEHLFKARNTAHPLHEPKPRSHPRPHPFVGLGRRTSSREAPRRGRRHGVSKTSKQRPDRTGVELDVVVQQQNDRLVEPLEHSVERGEPVVGLAYVARQWANDLRPVRLSRPSNRCRQR